VVRILVILADVFLLVTPPAQRDRRISHHHQSEFRVIVSRVVSNEYPRIVAGAGRCRPAGRGGGAVRVRVCRDSTDLYFATCLTELQSVQYDAVHQRVALLTAVFALDVLFQRVELRGERRSDSENLCSARRARLDLTESASSVMILPPSERMCAFRLVVHDRILELAGEAACREETFLRKKLSWELVLCLRCRSLVDDCAKRVVAVVHDVAAPDDAPREPRLVKTILRVQKGRRKRSGDLTHTQLARSDVAQLGLM